MRPQKKPQDSPSRWREVGAHVKANARVAENLYRKATGEGREAVTAAIFWLKTRARWTETSVHEHTGNPDRPIIVYTGVPRT